MEPEKEEKKRRLGWYYLGTWALLIVAGIVAKRVYGHPDWMVFFHLPAAVFLVMSFYILSARLRAQYQKDLSRFRKRKILDS